MLVGHPVGLPHGPGVSCGLCEALLLLCDAWQGCLVQQVGKGFEKKLSGCLLPSTSFGRGVLLMRETQEAAVFES